MKTKVKIICDVPNSMLKKGDSGYIDGYVRGGNDVPYAIVVVGEYIGFVNLYMLKVDLSVNTEKRYY